mmetsp:Transcript_4332/g.3836  ORF Transcript_4332/g.3836 Transcript_4332/m.3836 type:complete len:167 (+) Transcript_4332:355-855(+)
MTVDVGGNHTCITAPNLTKCYGMNTSGQSEVPHSISNGAIVIVLGECHTCVISYSGEVICWGCNSKGQTDVPVDNNLEVIDVATGLGHTCFIRYQTDLYCVGDNTKNQLVIRNIHYKDRFTRKKGETNKINTREKNNNVDVNEWINHYENSIQGESDKDEIENKSE